MWELFREDDGSGISESNIRMFTDMMRKRLIQGFTRYKPADARRRYMSRAIKELQKYNETGNAEQLLNVANYMLLEFYHPENRKWHFDNTTKSATRIRD